MTQEPNLLTVAEVAAKLRISDETVHRWARLGRLKFINVFGLKRFDRAYIEAIATGSAEEGAA